MSSEIIPKFKYYITATDKFMSGWGKATNKINKVVSGTNNYSEAESIERKFKNRPEFKNVNIRITKPYYDKKNYLISYIEKDSIIKHWK